MEKQFTNMDIEASLAPYIPLASEITGKDITLDRMVPLMAALDNPERKLKIIHIAGTSGKTSTTYYIAAMLTAAGLKVGMTVSPHIDSVTERLQINMQPISTNVFGAALAEFLDIIKKLDEQPTYFELLIAFAYWYFVKVGVDYAVIETGLGGLHDSTNIAKRADKICVITDIGYDHMQVLGNTLEEIAAQKAGIIHDQNSVYMYQQLPEITAQIISRCNAKNAQLNIVKEPTATEPDITKGLPEFQQHNWQLAYWVYEALAAKDGLAKLSAEELIGAAHVVVPARMDIRSIGNKKLIMDGAHNGQKMQAFIHSFSKNWPGKKAAVLLSLKSGKDYRDVLPLLADIADTLIITTFSFSQDRPFHGIDPSELALFAGKHNFKQIITEPDQTKAYRLLMSQPEDTLIITGSFYLIGQLRHKHKELQHG